MLLLVLLVLLLGPTGPLTAAAPRSTSTQAAIDDTYGHGGGRSLRPDASGRYPAAAMAVQDDEAAQDDDWSSNMLARYMLHKDIT